MKRHSHAHILAAALTTIAALPAGMGAHAARTIAGAPSSGDDRASLSASDQYAVSAAIGADQEGYHARRIGDGYAAENAGQELDLAFTGQGAAIGLGALSWRLSPKAWGYGKTLAPLPAAPPASEANRVSYQRGAVVEWYRNGPGGLQQGFTVERPPVPDSAGALTLAVDLPAGCDGRLDDDRTGVTLMANGAARLTYRGLQAWDATGSPLAAHLELAAAALSTPASLHIVVDDRDAKYPLTIDPWIQKAKLTASDGAAGDGFGEGAAISGDTVVVGATNGASNKGAAYVFVKPGGGWSTTSLCLKVAVVTHW